MRHLDFPVSLLDVLLRLDGNIHQRWGIVNPVLHRLHIPAKPFTFGRFALKLTHKRPHHKVRLGTLVEASLVIPLEEQRIEFVEGERMLFLIQEQVKQFIELPAETESKPGSHNVVMYKTLTGLPVKHLTSIVATYESVSGLK